MRRSEILDQQPDAGEKFTGHGPRAGIDIEKILDLRRDNQQRNAVGESDRHRSRNELYRLAEAAPCNDEQQDAGHQRNHQESGEPVSRNNTGYDDDESTRWPTDLYARPSQGGNE